MVRDLVLLEEAVVRMGRAVRGGSSRPGRSVLGTSLVATFAIVGCATADPGLSQVHDPYHAAEQPPTTAAQAADTVDWRHMHPDRVEDLIAGRFAGVEVIRLTNGGSAVRIRGVNTIMGNTEPLYIIDGLEVSAGPGGALAGLNPADIARIDVLKDPGSTAIYGIRGANGVILVTTKRGH